METAKERKQTSFRHLNINTLNAMKEAESGEELETLDLDNLKSYIAAL